MTAYTLTAPTSFQVPICLQTRRLKLQPLKRGHRALSGYDLLQMFSGKQKWAYDTQDPLDGCIAFLSSNMFLLPEQRALQLKAAACVSNEPRKTRVRLCISDLHGALCGLGFIHTSLPGSMKMCWNILLEHSWDQACWLPDNVETAWSDAEALSYFVRRPGRRPISYIT